jgi:hypothetical protein
MVLLRYWRRCVIIPIDLFYPHIKIYSVVNVANLKLYEPSMLDQENKEQVLPTIEKLTIKKEKLVEDIILYKKSKTTR